MGFHRSSLYPTQKTAPEWDGFIHFLEIIILLYSKKEKGRRGCGALIESEKSYL